MESSSLCMAVILVVSLFKNIPLTMQQSDIYINPEIAKELSSLLPYEKLAPIIFRFKMPSQEPANLIVTGIRTCANDGIASSWCPLHYHVGFARNLLRPLITLDSLKPAPTNSERAFAISNCNKVVSHFTSQHFSSSVLDSYITSLNSCFGTLQVVLDMDESFADTGYDDVYRQGHQSYSVAYWNQNTDFTLNAVHAVENTALITTGFVHYLSESLFWKEGLSRCQQNKIPSTHITIGNLNSSLGRLERIVALENYEFLIPKNYLRDYFDLPLTDCAIVENDELVVRLLVPLKRRDWKLFQFHTVPFAHVYENNNYICQHEPLESSNVFAFDTSTNTLLKAKCEKEDERFCLLQSTDLIQKKTCEQSILNGDNEEIIVNRCGLTCVPVENLNLPIVIKGTDDTFFVAGTHDYSVVVKCDGETDVRVDLLTEGAIQFNLPCSCTLESQTMIYSPSPSCGNQPYSIQNVLPVHFKTKYLTKLKYYVD